MGRQAKLKAARREAEAGARSAALARSIERDAASRAAQYERAPAGWLPVAVPHLADRPLDDWLKPMLPFAVPDGWRLDATAADGWRFLSAPPASLRLVCSGAAELDGRRWLHCSLTGPDRVPTWAEQVAVKELFCGKESCAVLLIPPRSEWVNNDPRCLHWWVCADGRQVPDFTQGKGSI